MALDFRDLRVTLATAFEFVVRDFVTDLTEPGQVYVARCTLVGVW